MFREARVVVFCDGDFWHWRDLDARLSKLASGHNAHYWVPKIRRNAARDRENNERLNREDWTILRYWETDIIADAAGIARSIRAVVERARMAPR